MNSGWNLSNDLHNKMPPRIYAIKQCISALVQNQDVVNVYFYKLRTLLDELINYESIPNCSCGDLLMHNQQRDWVMTFPVVLNDSYKRLKAHILLIKPFHTLNEVYSIIEQKREKKTVSL